MSDLRLVSADTVMCVYCHVNEAACIGGYEGNEADPEPACDECCGHGNEDGHCDYLDTPEGAAALVAWRAQQRVAT